MLLASCRYNRGSSLAYIIRATNLHDSFEFFDMILGGSCHLFTSYDESFVRRLQI